MLLNNPYETIQELSSGRVQMAEVIIHNLKTHWFLGEGYGNNTLVYQTFGIVHPHNALLATLLYNGWSGLIILIIFLILNIKQLFLNLPKIINTNFKWIFSIKSINKWF